MRSTMKQLFQPKNKDILNKILFTIGALIVFKIGTYITVPGATVLSGDLGYFEFLNMLGGGAFQNFSIFAIGVSPYITVSIITGLLQMDVVPYFSELKNQGEQGRRKLNQINRYLAILVAFIQGYIFALAYLNDPTALQIIQVAVILTAGTAFLLWLGDQITAKGMGNGISQIIMAGVIFSLPSMFASAYSALVDTTSTQTSLMGFVSFGIFVFLYLAIIVGVIFVQEAERRIPLQYSNRQIGPNSKGTFLPFKVNSAGVMPVIFASMVLTVPTLINSVVNNESVNKFIQKYLTTGTTVGLIIYGVLIFVFTYVYTFLSIRPKEVSENIKSSGAYIPGIRPGTETANYLKDVLIHLTFIGAIFLLAIALLPAIFSSLTSLPTTVQVGGTGLLIIVGVAIDTYKQIEVSLQSRNYGYKFK